MGWRDGLIGDRVTLSYTFMATCPKCMGALTENHKCPPRLFRRITDAISTVGLGGLAGAILCFAIDERPAGSRRSPMIKAMDLMTRALFICWQPTAGIV